MGKWQFVDPVTSTTYTFAINALTDQIQYEKNLQFEALVVPGSLPLLYEGQDQATTITLTGTLLTQTQWQKLIFFYELRHQFQLIDDRGYTRWVYPYQLQGMRKHSAIYPWKMDWTMMLYLMSDVFPNPPQS